MAQARLNMRPSHSDIRIVLLGKTGTGKSEIGNSILGSEKFKYLPGRNMTTTGCLRKIATRFEKNILVIDTPGQQDNKSSSHETRSEIQKSVEMAYPVSRTGNSGPNVFLLCLKMGRVTVEDETMFKECLVCFGEEMYRFTIVVFTHVDIWEANMAFSGKPPNKRSYIESLPDFAKEFIGKCRSKIYYYNRKTGPNMELQVKKLFQKIDEMIDLNSGNIYTEEILKQVLHREKMPNHMNFINKTSIVTSVLALGSAVLLFGILRK